MYRFIIRPLLFLIDPEIVHDLLFGFLKLYAHLTPIRRMVQWRYKTSLAASIKGMTVKSRVGLAAGFDKGAEVFDALADFGFGLIEVGTVTPNPQGGNPKPRIFRLVKDQSLISRTGFNNPGVDEVSKRIGAYKNRRYLLGVNINSNPTSTDLRVVDDFLLVFDKLYDLVDYFTINWGSIDVSIFKKVAQALAAHRSTKSCSKTIFIKIPADLNVEILPSIVEIARENGFNGFIATGPTMDRSQLRHLSQADSEKIGAGGLSGKGIGCRSIDMVKHLSLLVNDEFVIIGAGGIMNASDAADMLANGADFVQVYSAFIFSGPSVVKQMHGVMPL